ncbi:hypothetical protein QJS10_CPA03g00028 [Acorus calamus]|uniref:PIN-like protein n=1 Tax=Acorus calamus TaxID=4465 RepID=A0AAV9FBA1_ACOCL|nr:hypothetical protein QJS10_CPA03g00028 [Acorus calamus]
MPKMVRMLLSSLLASSHAGGESIFSTIKFAVLPIAKVFIMCFMGFLMASKYVNILSANGRKLLNGLVFSLLLPCLIFSQLGRAITVEKILQCISGSLIGLVVAAIVRPPYPFFKFTIIHIGIGNIGNVPLVLIAALCRDKSNPFGDSDKCSEDGNAYISFGQWMLAPPPEGSFDCTEEQRISIKNPSKDAAPEQVPLITQRESETSEMQRLKRGKIIGHLSYLVEKLKIKQIFQPPIIASEKLLVFIREGPGNSRLGFRTTAAIIFARLVLVPPAGFGIVMLADKLGFLPPGDKMFRFVLLLQHSMPTSVLSGYTYEA